MKHTRLIPDSVRHDVNNPAVLSSFHCERVDPATIDVDDLLARALLNQRRGSTYVEPGRIPYFVRRLPGKGISKNALV